MVMFGSVRNRRQPLLSELEDDADDGLGWNLDDDYENNP